MNEKYYKKDNDMLTLLCKVNIIIRNDNVCVMECIQWRVGASWVM